MISDTSGLIDLYQSPISLFSFSLSVLSIKGKDKPKKHDRLKSVMICWLLRPVQTEISETHHDQCPFLLTSSVQTSAAPTQSSFISLNKKVNQEMNISNQSSVKITVDSLNPAVSSHSALVGRLCAGQPLWCSRIWICPLSVFALSLSRLCRRTVQTWSVSSTLPKRNQPWCARSWPSWWRTARPWRRSWPSTGLCTEMWTLRLLWRRWETPRQLTEPPYHMELGEWRRRRTFRLLQSWFLNYNHPLFPFKTLFHTLPE